MVSERAQRGLDIPSLSSVSNKLHQNDPYHNLNTEVGCHLKFKYVVKGSF